MSLIYKEPIIPPLFMINALNFKALYKNKSYQLRKKHPGLWHTDGQTDRQTDRQTERQTDRQTDRQIDR